MGQMPLVIKMAEKSKKTLLIVVVVIVIVIIVAVGAYFAFSGGNDNKNQNDVTFLIQDDKGVYFWIEGNGETAMDALTDALSSYPGGTLVTSSYGIDSLFGQSSVQDSKGNWEWWIQFTWKDNGWSCNTTGLDEINSKDVGYELILFGSGNMDNPAATQAPAGTPVPSDAAVWGGNANGTVFQIQSESGLYFKINGTGGATLLDTFKNACDNYNISLETAHSTYDSNDYILGIFGITSYQDNSNNWHYWSEYEHSSSGWDYGATGMGGLTSADNPLYAVVFGDGSVAPT